MATVSWIGPNGNWTTGADWDTGTSPGAGDAAVLGTLNGYTVTLTTPITVNSIAISDQFATLTVTTPPGSSPLGTQTVTGDVVVGSGSSLNVFWNISDRGSATQGVNMVIGGSLTNSGVMEVDGPVGGAATPGGTTIGVAGTLTNASELNIGNVGMTLDSEVDAGGFSNTDTGFIFLEGTIGLRLAPSLDHLAWLNIGAAAPATWTGRVLLQGNSLLEFASGGITSIASGARIDLGTFNSASGDEARIAIASNTAGNSALAGLSSIAGELNLFDQAVVGTTTDLNVTDTGSLAVEDRGSLAIGGTLTNSNLVTVATSNGAGEARITAAGLSNTGAIAIAGAISTTFEARFQAMLDITAAAPTTWTGKVSLSGDSLLEFASGAITGIASGASISVGGFSDGSGMEARIAIASGDLFSNSALTQLTSNAGDFELSGGAMVNTNAGVDFTNSGILGLDRFTISNSLAFDTTLAIGGMFTDTSTGAVTIGDVSLSNSTGITAAGFSNAGMLSIIGGSASAIASLTVNGSSSNSGNVTIGSFAVFDDGANSYNQTAGTTIVTGKLNAAAVNITGGLVELAVGGVVSGGIDFRSVAGSTLKIDGTTMPSNTISGFVPGDTFDLASIALGDTTGASLDTTSDVLTVTTSGGSFTLQLSGSYAAGTLVDRMTDGAGTGTDLSLRAAGPAGTGFTTPLPWVKHGGSFVAGEAQYADLNGDGKADLILQGLDDNFWVSLSTGTGFTNPQSWIKHGGTFQAGEAQYADLNGDGKADLILQGLDDNFWVSLSTGTGFTNPQSWIKHGGTFQAGEAQYADLNGDGKADLIMQGLDDTFWVSLSTGTGFTNPQPWIKHGGTFQAGEAQYADLNGDGKADLIMQGLDNDFWVSLSTGTGFTNPQPWIKHGGTFQAGEAQYADLNGDGKADLIMQGLDDTFWVSLSTGTGFTDPLAWIKHGGSFQAGEAQYADLNGDGKADLIMQGLDNTFWVSLSTGTGFTNPQPWIQHGGSFVAGEAQYADLNGDGKADLIMQGLDDTFWVSLSTGNPPPMQGGRTASAQSGTATQPAPSGTMLSGMPADPGMNGAADSNVTSVPSGDLMLTAQPAPETFDFGGWVFGNAEIAGFDPTQDAVLLSSGLVGSFASVEADMSAAGGGTLITFDASHSLTLDGVAPASLGAANFRFT